MSDELPPPFEPGKNPADLPPPPTHNPPNFWLMFGLGILLVIVSCALCPLVQSPAPVGISALLAFITLFFRGYRGIFIGYISTVGVVLLCCLVMCGAILSGNMH